MGSKTYQRDSRENRKQEIGNAFKEFALKGRENWSRGGERPTEVLFYFILLLKRRNNNMFRRNTSLLLSRRI